MHLQDIGVGANGLSGSLMPTTRGLKAIQDPQGKAGRFDCADPSPDKTLHQCEVVNEIRTSTQGQNSYEGKAIAPLRGLDGRLGGLPSKYKK